MSEDNQEKSEEGIKAIGIQSPWKVFFWEAFLYSLVLGFGILTAIKIKEILKIQEISPKPLPLGIFF